MIEYIRPSTSRNFGKDRERASRPKAIRAIPAIGHDVRIAASDDICYTSKQVMGSPEVRSVLGYCYLCLVSSDQSAATGSCVPQMMLCCDRNVKIAASRKIARLIKGFYATEWKRKSKVFSDIGFLYQDTGLPYCATSVYWSIVYHIFLGWNLFCTGLPGTGV
jgi:hypothetical protein